MTIRNAIARVLSNSKVAYWSVAQRPPPSVPRRETLAADLKTTLSHVRKDTDEYLKTVERYAELGVELINVGPLAGNAIRDSASSRHPCCR